MAQLKSSNGSKKADPVTTTTKAETKKNDKRTGWIIGGVVAAVVVVLAILACVLLPKLMGADYQESEEVADELFDKLEDVYGSYTAVCYNALSNVDDDDLSVAAYQKKIDDCKQSMAEARELADKLEQTSGVKNDTEVKEKYDAFVEAAKPVLLDASQVDKSLETYVAVHEFLINMEKYEADTSEAEIKTLTAPLVEVDNEKLKAFGEELRGRMVELGKIYQKFVASGQSDRKLAAEYLEKAEELQDWMETLDFEEEELVDLTSDRVNDMLDKYEELLRLISEKNTK